MKKRLTAWLLTLSMLLTMFSPLSAMAEATAIASDSNLDVALARDSAASWSDVCVVASSSMNISSTGINLIKSFESCKLTAYKALSSEKYYTIGWGHYGSDVYNGMEITQEQADALFEQDIVKYVGYVNRFLSENDISVSQNQFDALCSFTYNVGNVWYSSSYPTFQLKTILCNGANNYSDSQIRTAFTNWNKSGGNVIAGLTRRRNAEADLFLDGTASNNLPNLCVDVVQGWQNHIYVKGWAFDPDTPNAKVAVHVYINNECHEVIADKYHDQQLDDTFHCGTDHGFALDIPTDQTGEVTVSFYAIDEQDANQHSEPSDSYSSYKNPTKVTITSDKTGPTITNAKVTNVDSTGYTVTCTVTDASGVNRVQFPTWTEKNGQDDLLSNWEVSSKASGTRNGNTFTFRVKTSDHNNESGTYNTHIYAYDNSYRGNCAGAVTLTATVPVPTVAVTGVSLNKTSLSFTGTGSSQTLTATVSPSNATNKTLTWSSSNTSVATVSNGVVKAVGFGTATITAKSNNGKTASCSVTVNPIQPTGIKATPETSTLYGLNGTVKLSANVMPSNATNKAVTWSSRNTSVATVSSDGTVKAVGYGTAVITAKTVNGLTSNCTINVKKEEVTSLTIATKPTKTNYYVGDTLNTAGLTLKAAYNNGTTQTITGGFTCTPTALSTAGAQTVTVNYGGKTATFTVSVELPVLPFVTLTFDPTDGVLDLADTPEKTVYPGEAYGRLPEPTADGMVFLGWYTESGKRITSLTTCDLTGDATVSARWALASAEGWSFDEATGTLTLDGSGAMKEYTSAAEAPWYSYRDSIEHLVVKSGVTSLSSYAFVGCQNLEDITLPDTLQTIGTMTFYGCDNLNNVTIPASVRTIGSYAFADALSLSRITFAGDAPEFGTGVFTFRKLTAYYPVYASGWETVVDGRYDFGGSITWVRSSESLAAEEPVLLSAAEPDDVLALDWTL